MPSKREEKAGPSNQEEDTATIHSLLDEEIDRISLSSKKVQHYKKLKYLRIAILFIFWFTFTSILMVTDESSDEWKGISVPTQSEGKEFPINQAPSGQSLTLILQGPFINRLNDVIARKLPPDQGVAEGKNEFYLIVNVRRRLKTGTGQFKTEYISKPWRLKLTASNNFDDQKRRSREHVFELTTKEKLNDYSYHFQLENVEEPLPLLTRSYPGRIKSTGSAVLSSLIIVGLYAMLLWDVTSRAIIGLIFCTLSIALTGIYHTRLELPEIAKFVWIDYILLLMGLTIICGVFTETGGDLYMAVQMFRWSNGHLWPMLTVLCLITAAGSAFLDQLTIMMLITSFAIRICEIHELNPGSVLTCLILFSNIGYMLTPIGITQNSVLEHKGIVNTPYKYKSYGWFMLHMLIPVSIALAITYVFLRRYYRNTRSMQIIEPPIVSRLRHAIRFWNRTAKSLGDYSEIEKAVQQRVNLKVNRLRSRLKRLGKMPLPTEDFNDKLKRLQEKHKLRDKPRLVMCVTIILMVIIMQLAFFLHLHYLLHGWTCLLFSLILLALANGNDFESLMTKMDWSTVFMISCTMILTKAISPLGLLEGFSDTIVEKICDINGDYRLYLAAIIMILISAVGSAFFDPNYIAFTMVGIVLDLIHASDIKLPLEPLILAVILGTGFGVNVTLISTYSNIACVGIAEKHEFKFYFWDFFKIGAIVTCFNLILSIIYVLLFIVVLNY